MEERKQREREHADHLQAHLRTTGDPKYTAYRKWYDAGYRAYEWFDSWVRSHATNMLLLDYACGTGGHSIEAAKVGADVIGIDISGASIEIAKRNAADMGVVVDFRVMDAEYTEFEPHTFDVVMCSGVLHHMVLAKAYPEIARILKPEGSVIALEALGHNPLINWYRKRTPYLRSPDEHPLNTEELELAKRYFERVSVRYFNLATLAAAPLWKTPLIRPAADLLGLVDAVLLRVPFIQRQAWMAGMLLSKPK